MMIANQANGKSPSNATGKAMKKDEAQSPYEFPFHKYNLYVYFANAIHSMFFEKLSNAISKICFFSRRDHIVKFSAAHRPHSWTYLEPTNPSRHNRKNRPPSEVTAIGLRIVKLQGVIAIARKIVKIRWAAPAAWASCLSRVPNLRTHIICLQKF